MTSRFLAEQVRDACISTGRFVLVGDEPAIMKPYGDNCEKFALVFSDGSELDISIEDIHVRKAFWTKSGESSYSLNGEEHARVSHEENSVAKSIHEHLKNAHFLFETTSPVILKAYGKDKEMMAMVFHDGSELDFYVSDFSIRQAFWTPQGHNRYDLAPCSYKAEALTDLADGFCPTPPRRAKLS